MVARALEVAQQSDGLVVPTLLGALPTLAVLLVRADGYVLHSQRMARYL